MDTANSNVLHIVLHTVLQVWDKQLQYMQYSMLQYSFLASIRKYPGIHATPGTTSEKPRPERRAVLPPPWAGERGRNEHVPAAEGPAGNWESASAAGVRGSGNAGGRRRGSRFQDASRVRACGGCAWRARSGWPQRRWAPGDLRALCTLGADGIVRLVCAIGDRVRGVPCRVLQRLAICRCPLRIFRGARVQKREGRLV